MKKMTAAKEAALRRTLRSTTLGAILLTLLTAAAYGQVDQGKIQGVIKDATGASIPGVSITVKNDRTGEERETTTGDRGDYIVTALRPSTYTVRASLAGFASEEVKGVQLAVGQRLTVDLALSPAGVSQEVTVSADAAEIGVETSSASMSANVDVREATEPDWYTILIEMSVVEPPDHPVRFRLTTGSRVALKSCPIPQYRSHLRRRGSFARRHRSSTVWDTTVGKTRSRQVLQGTRTLMRLPFWQSYCATHQVWMFM
jgi:hypothetical protein